MKKSLALIISAVIIITSLTSPAMATTVSDIDGHWAQGYIQQLVDRGIIGGYPDGTFKPENPISRAEFCTIITKALVNDGVIADFTTPTGMFNDVATGEWYAKYIETAATNGFVGGKGEGKFDPEAFITRQEMAKIVSLVYCQKNAAGFNTLRDSTNLADYNLSDLAAADTWATDFIKVALKANLMRGNEDGTFAPLGLVTRAETATVTFRILGLALPTDTPIVSVKPTDTPTPVPTDTPTPVPTAGAIRSHGTELTFVNMSLSNYPNFVQDPPTDIAILVDGIANDFKWCISCNLSEPEYLFDLGSAQSIQSLAIAGFQSGLQSVLFRLMISEDLESWTELGVDVNLKIAQPIIEDKTIYKPENFDTLTVTGRMNPAPTRFDTTTTDEIFTRADFQTRTHYDVNGNEIDTDCFETPHMNNAITSIDWQSYGYVDSYCNYMFHFFMDEVQSAQYIKIIGYGNTQSQWYMFSSFTEVKAFGPDAVI